MVIKPDNKRVSIIIPAYKVDKYLQKCINSVINQTYSNLEILLIDDGSTDRCGLICDQYANIDSRIVVFHQINAGVSMARNVGLDYCSGDYLLFIDSDDWTESDMIETLLESISDDEMAVCNYYRTEINDDNTIEKENERNMWNENSNMVFHSNDVCFDVFSKSGVLWNKIFKREVVGHDRFVENLVYGEDTVFLSLLANKIKAAACVSKPLYHYVCNRSGKVTSSDYKAYAVQQFINNAEIIYHNFAKTKEVQVGIFRILVIIDEVSIKIDPSDKCFLHEYAGRCRDLMRLPSISDFLSFVNDPRFNRKAKKKAIWLRVAPYFYLRYVMFGIPRFKKGIKRIIGNKFYDFLKQIKNKKKFSE